MGGSASTPAPEDASAAAAQQASSGGKAKLVNKTVKSRKASEHRAGDVVSAEPRLMQEVLRRDCGEAASGSGLEANEDLEELREHFDKLNDNSPHVRLAACKGLARLGPKAAPLAASLATVLNDENRQVRSKAAEVLKNCGGAGALSVFGLLNQEVDEDVRQLIFMVLRKNNQVLTPEAIGSLARAELASARIREQRRAELDKVMRKLWDPSTTESMCLPAIEEMGRFEAIMIQEYILKDSIFNQEITGLEILAKFLDERWLVEIRWRVVRKLGEFRGGFPAELRHAMVSFINDKAWQVRAQALEALMHIAPKHHLKTRVEDLIIIIEKDESWIVREAAAKALNWLTAIDAAAVRPKVRRIEALQRGTVDIELQRELKDILSMIETKAGKKEVIKDRSTSTVVKAAPSTWDLIKNLFDDASPEMRRVMALLRHDEPDVRQQALATIEGLESRQVFADMVACMIENDAVIQVRARAIRTLVAIGPTKRDHCVMLAARLLDSEESIREAAARAFGDFGDFCVPALVHQILRESRGNQRLQLQQALSLALVMPPEVHCAFLCEWLHTVDEKRREALSIFSSELPLPIYGHKVLKKVEYGAEQGFPFALVGSPSDAIYTVFAAASDPWSWLDFFPEGSIPSLVWDYGLRTSKALWKEVVATAGQLVRTLEHFPDDVGGPLYLTGHGLGGLVAAAVGLILSEGTVAVSSLRHQNIRTNMSELHVYTFGAPNFISRAEGAGARAHSRAQAFLVSRRNCFVKALIFLEDPVPALLSPRFRALAHFYEHGLAAMPFSLTRMARTLNHIAPTTVARLMCEDYEALLPEIELDPAYAGVGAKPPRCLDQEEDAFFDEAYHPISAYVCALLKVVYSERSQQDGCSAILDMKGDVMNAKVLFFRAWRRRAQQLAKARELMERSSSSDGNSDEDAASPTKNPPLSSAEVSPPEEARSNLIQSRALEPERPARQAPLKSPGSFAAGPMRPSAAREEVAAGATVTDGGLDPWPKAQSVAMAYPQGAERPRNATAASAASVAATQARRADEVGFYYL